MNSNPEAKEGEQLREIVLYLLYEPIKKQFLLEYKIKPSSNTYHRIIVPGGDIEEGESPLIAAIREISEERGVEPTEIIKLQTFTDFVSKGEKANLHPYLILNWEGDVENKEPEKSVPVWADYVTSMSLFDSEISKKVLDLAQRIIKVKEEQKED